MISKSMGSIHFLPWHPVPGKMSSKRPWRGIWSNTGRPQYNTVDNPGAPVKSIFLVVNSSDAKPMINGVWLP
jgi:hypothetical protein